MLGTDLDAKMYIDMTRSYVYAINTGGIPDISSAWENIMENQCLSVKNEVIYLIKVYSSV